MLAQTVPHPAQARAAADALRLAVALQVFGHVTAALLVDGTDGAVYPSRDMEAAAKASFYAADTFLAVAKISPEALAAEIRGLETPVPPVAPY